MTDLVPKERKKEEKKKTTRSCHQRRKNIYIYLYETTEVLLHKGYSWTDGLTQQENMKELI